MIKQFNSKDALGTGDNFYLRVFANVVLLVIRVTWVCSGSKVFRSPAWISLLGRRPFTATVDDGFHTQVARLVGPSVVGRRGRDYPRLSGRPHQYSGLGRRELKTDVFPWC